MVIHTETSKGQDIAPLWSAVYINNTKLRINNIQTKYLLTLKREEVKNVDLRVSKEDWYTTKNNGYIILLINRITGNPTNLNADINYTPPENS